MLTLKQWKSGVEYVTKHTNQRSKTPEPVLVQVDASSSLSLVGGNVAECFVWRSGIVLPDAPRQRFGIPSKMLVQSMKALRGSKTTLSIAVEDSTLLIKTSEGGELSIPAVDSPETLRPWPSQPSNPKMALRKGTLSRWASAFTTAFSPNEDSVQFDTDGRVSATDGYIMFDTHGTLDSNLAERKHVRASFWNALRAATSDAVIEFGEKGIRVRAGEYEALASYLEGQRVYPDMKQHYYPDGVTPKNYVLVDKRVFTANVRAVASTTAKEQVFLSLPLNVKDLVIKGIQSGTNIVMEAKRRSNSWGTIECSAKFIIDILSAIDSNQAIISWTDNVSHPLGIRDASQQHEWFLLAPVVHA